MQQSGGEGLFGRLQPALFHQGDLLRDLADADRVAPEPLDGKAGQFGFLEGG